MKLSSGLLSYSEDRFSNVAQVLSYIYHQGLIQARRSIIIVLMCTLDISGSYPSQLATFSFGGGILAINVPTSS